MSSTGSWDSGESESDNFGVSTFNFDEQAPKGSSAWLPVLIALGLLVLAAIAVGLSWGAPEANFPIIAFIGYFLAPLATALLLAWTLAKHRRLSATDTYDMRAGRRTVSVGVTVALAGFVVGALLVFRIAVWVAQLPLFNGGTS